MPVSGEVLELDQFNGTEAEAIIKALREHGLDDKLAPQFRVDFQRMAWLLRPFPRTQPMFRAEVVLDRGDIIAAGHRNPVSEIEIELKHGHTNELTRVADMLMRDIGLKEEPASKARRGYAMLGEQKSAQK